MNLSLVNSILTLVMLNLIAVFQNFNTQYLEIDSIRNQLKPCLAKDTISVNALNKKAYETNNVYNAINDSLLKEKNLRQKIDLEYQYKYEKEKQIQELERQKIVAINKQQKIILYLFIVGFILMSLLIIVVSRGFLHKRKANRLLALQKRQIEIKNKKLKESNDTKDKFFSIIAHDLRSPFNVMIGLSNLLSENYEDFSDEERCEIFDSLNKSSKDTFKLVENLLTWSRTQTGTIEYLPENLNLKELVSETMNLLQKQFIKKDIYVLNAIEEDEPIYADKNMLSTVFRNLISNAIKFTPHGGEIIIGADKTKDENDRIITRISVKDNGVGISNEMESKLFDISVNSSTTGTENETGTGLGLVLCEEFIKKHSGKIFVESEVGKGSTFVFTIPSPS